MLKPSFFALRLCLLTASLASSAFAFGFPEEVGQSFTPKLVGSTPGTLPLANSFATLTDYTFVTSGSLPPTTLYITSSVPSSSSSIASEAIATSSNNYTDIASDPRFGNSRTRVYHFGAGVSLDTDLIYYALFPVSAYGTISLSSSNPYASGQLYVISGGTYSAGPTGWDAYSGATFASAVPEPAAFTALAGLGALAIAGRRRRRSRTEELRTARSR